MKFDRPCHGGPCTEKGMAEPGFCKCKEAEDEIVRLRTALRHYAKERGIFGTVAREALKEQ